MQTITTIGLDIAKSIFQVHGVDAAGNVIVRKMKRRYLLAFSMRRVRSSRRSRWWAFSTARRLMCSRTVCVHSTRA
jgi:hypothetical protein